VVFGGVPGYNCGRPRLGVAAGGRSRSWRDEHPLEHWVQRLVILRVRAGRFIIAAIRTDRFLPISEYGVIGNLFTVALVGSDGSIDWSCFPRVDSPSVFGALLDADRAGRFRIAPVDVVASTQRYDGATNVLVTEFVTSSGAHIELTDFMPAPETGKGGLPVYHEIHRRVRVLDGMADIRVLFAPQFDYGRARTRLLVRQHGIIASDGERESLAVVASPALHWFIDTDRAEARGRVALHAGEEVWVVCRWDDDEVMPIEKYHSALKLDATCRFWTDWSSTIRYDGPYGDAVVRSALVLKLLFYAPSGAVVAAATTSLPEGIGGVRNWDYRFVWLRDAAFTLGALHKLGFTAEADHFMDYLKRIARKSAGHLQIMYGVEGERSLEEETLDHLSGYRDSRPVRIGNGAYDQLQTDVYGEVVDAVCTFVRRGGRPDRSTLQQLVALGKTVCRFWREPDEGIWEIRGDRRHHTHSKLMCWVALDRLIWLHERKYLSAPVEAFRKERDAIRDQIEGRGYNEALASYVHVFDGSEMDAALLMMILHRYQDPASPRLRSTFRRICRELGRDGLEAFLDGMTRDQKGFPADECRLRCRFYKASFGDAQAAAMIAGETARVALEDIRQEEPPHLIWRSLSWAV
jgi:GH15 family glucan-1,4-alpha-glucosidase